MAIGGLRKMDTKYILCEPGEVHITTTSWVFCWKPYVCKECTDMALQLCQYPGNGVPVTIV
jgi:hypothetical protein